VKGFASGGKERCLGEIEIDISQFVGAQNQVKTYQLSKTLPKTSTANLTLQISILKEEGKPGERGADHSSSSEDEDPLVSGAAKMRSATTKVEGPKAFLAREERKQTIQQKPLSKEDLEAENTMRQTRIKELEEAHAQLKKQVEASDLELHAA